jgi:hypothetical protein
MQPFGLLQLPLILPAADVPYSPAEILQPGVPLLWVFGRSNLDPEVVKIHLIGAIDDLVDEISSRVEGPQLGKHRDPRLNRRILLLKSVVILIIGPSIENGLQVPVHPLVPRHSQQSKAR